MTYRKDLTLSTELLERVNKQCSLHGETKGYGI